MSAATSPGLPVSASARELCDRYDGFLLDAFGVLVDGRAALPGAAAFLAELARRGLPYSIVTNDASRRSETNAARFRRFGLDVEPERFLSSGDLIAPHFAAHGLAGARCLVLGTDDSRRFVTDAGGHVCPIDPAGTYDAVIVCDDDGFPFLDGMNAALSVLFRAFDAGRDIHMLLPNPDVVYPAGDGAYGFTSGAIALLLEEGLARRYPERRPKFIRLGKPYRPLFDEAARRLAAQGATKLIMIGDQLETDIAGALGAGLDAALLATGVTRWSEPRDVSPTYLLDRLS
jgi:HAD superfamily hydrolase (TIGR01459 family)